MGDNSFSEWFCNSQVVDAAGLPLVVYHGTSVDFESFRAGPSGLFFSPDPQVASAYAFGHDDDEGARVFAVYLALENPLVTTEQWLNDFERRAVPADIKRRNFSNSTMEKTFAEAFLQSEPWARELVQTEARRLGHDGMILPEDACPVEHMGGDWSVGISFVVFDGSQVRLAAECACQVEIEYGLNFSKLMREHQRG